MDDNKGAEVESRANGEQQTESFHGAHVGERESSGAPDKQARGSGTMPSGAACGVSFGSLIKTSHVAQGKC